MTEKRSICVAMDIASIAIGNDTMHFYVPTGSDGITTVRLVSEEEAEQIGSGYPYLFVGKNLKVFGYDCRPYENGSMEIGTGAFTIRKVKGKFEWVIAPFSPFEDRIPTP